MKYDAFEQSRWTGAHDRAAIARSAARDGYIFVRDLVPKPLVADVRDVAVAAAQARGWLRPDGDDALAAPGASMSGLVYDDPQWITMQQEVLPSPAVAALESDPTLLCLVEAILGSAPVPQGATICRLFLPGSHAQTTRPHQDAFYVGDASSMWTLWLPLLPCPITRGSLAVIPGSHLGPIQPHDTRHPLLGLTPDPEARWATSEMMPGDVLAFHGRTIHTPAVNTTQHRPRLSIDLRFAPRAP